MRVLLASSVGAITGCPGIRRVEVELFDSDVGFCLGLLRSRSKRGPQGSWFTATAGWTTTMN